jgi:hypothetical protein
LPLDIAPRFVIISLGHNECQSQSI